MFNMIKNGIAKFKNVFNPIGGVVSLGIKGIKSFVDNNFRSKVVPVEGSVLYCDLYVGAEHSGIYISNKEISNIVVDGFAESVVERSKPDDFVEKSILHKNIYVSCDKGGAVGNIDVSSGAAKHLGDRGFYGLIFSNCHEFSRKCVNYSREDHNLKSFFSFRDIDETWELTIRNLKATSRKKLGATKWKLWDWKNEESNNKTKEPNQKEIEKFWKNLILNDESINLVKDELSNANMYMEEISDENLPKKAIDIINNYKILMSDIETKYSEVRRFIQLTGGEYSYKDIEDMGDDFLSLVKEMDNNQNIKKIVEKLGRDYISEEKKLRPQVMKRMNNEVMGIHKSNDLMRVLPSEMVNLESEELEYLFYSKMLENSLLTYKIISKDTEFQSQKMEEYTESEHKKKGPVIACLDTSGSMHGLPILKAKALLLSVSRILEKEKRNLYILLFGGSGQIKELNINKSNENIKIIPFLNSGFGGGTDFKTPINRGIEIIKSHNDYNKADILIVTDGLCSLDESYIKTLNTNKINMDFSIYTIICNGDNSKDSFSDEVIGI